VAARAGSAAATALGTALGGQWRSTSSHADNGCAASAACKPNRRLSDSRAGMSARTPWSVVLRASPLSAYACDQRRSEAIRGDQRPSKTIRGDQRRSEAIRGDQRRSAVISDDQRRSAAISGDQRRSEAIRGDQWRSAVISSDECRSASISSTQRHSPAPHVVETTARDDARHPTDARVIGCARCPGWPRSQ
jgi:hypothetical protein